MRVTDNGRGRSRLQDRTGHGLSSFSGSLERSWLVLSRDLLDEHKLRLENELFSVMQVTCGKNNVLRFY